MIGLDLDGTLEDSRRRLFFKKVWIVLFIFFVFFVTPSSRAAEKNAIFITQLAVSRGEPKILYAVTTYSTGVLKSLDEGAHWSLINQGIKSYSLYHFAIHPGDSNIIYLGAGGGGLYKSVDAGENWMEMNDGLQDTDIGQMFLHPEDPEKIYVVCATGVYRSPDGGKHWEAWNQGDTFTTSQEFQNIAIMPGHPARLFLASKKGLYTRAEDEPAWRLASKMLEGKMVSALAVDPSGKRLFAAVLHDGHSLKGGGLYWSGDHGTIWHKLGKGIDKDWIRVIRFDPTDPKRIYLATTGRGVLASTDGGKKWSKSNQGMTAPDLRALILDPSNPRILYAGAHGEGVFKSADKGKRWIHLDSIPMLDSNSVIAKLKVPDPNRPEPDLTPPPAFAKCNKCHGWTDPYLNMTPHSFWLVAANRRNWSLTVRRMSRGANLMPDEEMTISDFLQEYSEKYSGR
ncbi:MAG: hypothetical protein HY202_02110 [Nitrospirae bacterium]|nr:hypothetical protein [Nitrospirota bacterium]